MFKVTRSCGISKIKFERGGDRSFSDVICYKYLSIRRRQLNFYIPILSGTVLCTVHVF